MIATELLSPITIDDVEVDVLSEHTIELKNDITEFPVETGFSISDHTIKKQPTLSLVVIFTPMPVTWYELRKDEIETRLDDVKKALWLIRDKGDPITVKTHDYVYENMVLKSIKFPRNKEDGYCLKVAIDFVQVIIVDTEMAEIPAKYAEQNAKIQAQADRTEQNAGTASTSDIGSGGTGSTDTATTAGDTSDSYDTGSEQTATEANKSWAASIADSIGL